MRSSALSRAAAEAAGIETLGSEVTDFSGWLSVEKRHLQVKGQGELDTHVVRFPDIALMVGVFEERVVLVRQFRFPANRWILESPAGRVEPGEDPAVAAERELTEETGFTCTRLEKLGELRLAPHLSNEVTHVYRALGLRPGVARPERGELLSTEQVPVGDLRGLVRSGEINDAKTLSALVLAELL
jgi:ADP-ribose pyrophosphatase